MKNNDDYVLTIDFGTQSVRTIIFDYNGNVIAFAKSEYEEPYFSPAPGYCEQNPEYYWEHMLKTTNEVARQAPDVLQKIKSMGITCFRDTPVFLDKDLNVVRPSILWLDQRQAVLKEKLPLFHRFAFKIVGMSEVVKLNMKRTPAIWLQENEPENWNKIDKYVPLSCYLIYRLTGQLKDSPANCTGHFPINFKKLAWRTKHDLQRVVFRIPNRMLCDLVPVGEAIGTISEEVSKVSGIPAGINLYSTGSDKGSETIGTGSKPLTMASISYGTASSVEVMMKKYVEPSPFLPAYGAPIPGFYQTEFQVYRGYWMITWFMKEFGKGETAEAKILDMATEEVLNQKMLAIPPGSDGLVLQPYWGPGLDRPEARGAVIGWTDIHTRMHLYRAIVEGIAYELRDNLERIEKNAHTKVTEIRLSGGGARSSAICQITADIFGLPVARVKNTEAASVGTAIAVGLADGTFKSLEEATERMVEVQDRFEPNPENQAKYDYLFNKVYKHMYPRLSSLYKKIREYKNEYPSNGQN